MRSFQNLSKINGVDIDRLKKLIYQKTLTGKDIKEFKGILDRLIGYINLLNILENNKPRVQIETTYDFSSSLEEEEEEDTFISYDIEKLEDLLNKFKSYTRLRSD